MLAETPQSFFQTPYLFDAPFNDIFIVRVDDRILLHPQIQNALSLEHQRNLDHHICKHDIGHINRSTENGLVLLHMWQTDTSMSPSVDEITPTLLAFTIAGHDLGYGSENIRIVNLHAIGHEQESVQIIDKLTQELPENHPSRRYMRDKQNLILSGILGTASSHETLIQNAFENPTPTNLFALLISAAEKADYFIRDRVADLLPPDATNNQYHILAFAVDDYQLSINHQTKKLTYSLTLHQDIPFADNPEMWKEQAIRNFSQVFELLKAVAAMGGYEFDVSVVN